MLSNSCLNLFPMEIVRKKNKKPATSTYNGYGHTQDVMSHVFCTLLIELPFEKSDSSLTRMYGRLIGCICVSTVHCTVN